jgi:lysyl-tRNA synthetase class 2
MADEWQLAAKALRPLPVLHREMNEETRIRQRYVDLIVRPAAREMVHVRAAVMASLRRTFDRHGFLEVETPMLQTLHGGAAARPFATRSNAMGMELFLRIAPELFLKRALVGGIDRVFEINRNFRNEGADSSHSPEFAMLEFYQAYGNDRSVGALTEELVQNAALDAFGSTTVQLRDGSDYDLSGPWQWIDMYPAVSAALGEQVTPSTPLQDLKGHSTRLGLQFEAKHVTAGKLVEGLFEHLVGDSLHAPTFVRGFPVETSPLVKESLESPGTVEKWDLYVRGFELATGYSELNDPVIQRQRFVEQAGLGIDRLLMALTGAGIRETILFPLVKPEG